MNPLALYGIGMGLLLFVAFVWVEKQLMKAFEINPLLELGAIYLAFYLFPDLAYGVLPESWKMMLLNNPFQLEGSVGFILRLNKPQMSIADLGFSIFLVCLMGRFVYALAGKKSLWRRIDDKEDQ